MSYTPAPEVKKQPPGLRSSVLETSIPDEYLVKMVKKYYNNHAINLKTNMNFLHQLTPHRLRKYLNLNNAAVAVALLIAASWTWGTMSTLQKNFALQQRLDNLNQQNEIIKLQNQTLEYQQAYYKSDEYLELAARDLLELGQPGEKLLILPDSSQIQDDSRPERVHPRQPSNFSQWMMFFFGDKSSPS